ncbi:MAG: hypothetical protein JO242_01660 [Streptosporangiaceae bacterium]|nr:hypothetical protein [Streptosporangiaceae bacterium]
MTPGLVTPGLALLPRPVRPVSASARAFPVRSGQPVAPSPRPPRPSPR